MATCRFLDPPDDDDDDDEAVEAAETAAAESNEFQEDKSKFISGQEYRLYRTKNDRTGVWESSERKTPNFDSIVHRAARLGLLRRDAASQQDIDESRHIREQAAAFRQESIVDCTENRYDSQSRLECYVKSLGDENGGVYYSFLTELELLINKHESSDDSGKKLRCRKLLPDIPRMDCLNISFLFCTSGSIAVETCALTRSSFVATCSM